MRCCHTICSLVLERRHLQVRLKWERRIRLPYFSVLGPFLEHLSPICYCHHLSTVGRVMAERLVPLHFASSSKASHVLLLSCSSLSISHVSARTRTRTQIRAQLYLITVWGHWGKYYVAFKNQRFIKFIDYPLAALHWHEPGLPGRVRCDHFLSDAHSLVETVVWTMWGSAVDQEGGPLWKGVQRSFLKELDFCCIIKGE